MENKEKELITRKFDKVKFLIGFKSRVEATTLIKEKYHEIKRLSNKLLVPRLRMYSSFEVPRSWQSRFLNSSVAQTRSIAYQ